MNSATRAKVNKNKGIMEKRIRNCPCQLHFPSHYKHKIVCLNTSHVLKSGTTINKVEERVILLWALLPLVLTALSLHLAAIWVH